MTTASTLGPKEAPMTILAQHQADMSALLSLPLRSVVESEAGPLVVCHRFFGMAPIESVLDGTALAESVTLTSDGRQALTTIWHTGPEAEWVFVERWTPAGRVFHGFVDSASRRLLQTG